MSYLLTEIALEMLGYKFYDIDGKQGATNFQSNGQQNCNNNDIETVESEETLETILDITQTPSSTAIENLPEPFESGHIDETPISKPIIESNSIPNEHLNDQNCTDTEQQQKENTKRSLPNALTRLLDHEYEKIRKQIIRNKNVYFQSNSELLKRIDQRGIAAVNETLTPFNNQERANLQKELQTVHAFRTKIERSLFKINAENYEKYKRTFVGQSVVENP